MIDNNLEVKQWKIDDLIGAEYNPRKLSPEQKKTIKDSITRFGLVDPVLVNINKERKGIIIGGHQRTMIARELGFKKMPCIELDLTLEKEKELNVRLNKNTGDFDFDLLSEHFEDSELISWGFDEDDLEFFDGEETLEAEEDDFEISEEIETDIVLGDLIEIGEHRLMCGDSTCSDTVKKLMDGEKCNLITDPPYGINANKQTLGTGKKQFHRGDDWDVKVPDFYYIIPLVEKSIIWGGNYFADKLAVNNDWLCWHKKNDGLSFSEFELAWSNIGKNTRIISHHWGGETKQHPTMKPVKVIEWCVNLLEDSKPILDIFLGSGSTMVAAHQLKRKCYGMELDPKYCQVIIDRMRKLDPDLIIKRNGKEI